MNISPPIALRFSPISSIQVSAARAGICPHCALGVATLALKHTSGALQFLECSTCQVVVALEKA